MMSPPTLRHRWHQGDGASPAYFRMVEILQHNLAALYHRYAADVMQIENAMAVCDREMDPYKEKA